MKKLYFVFNLVSGKAVVSSSLGDIINAFTKAGYEVTAHPTQNSDDAALSAKYAAENGFDLIVCAGGDGTLSQCLNGLMNSSRIIPIGYIPTGSTNDFAKTLGIPKGIVPAAEWIINGKVKLGDVGHFNDEFFSYIVAFGAFTSVTYETSQQVKNLLGHAAYILNCLTQLSSLRSKRMRIEYGNNIIEDDFIFGMVTNSSSVAGLLSLSDFLLDDGQFEVTLIKKPKTVLQLQNIVHSLLNITEEIDKEYIRFFKTDKITFTSLSDEPITWTRDGEYGGELSVNTIENCKCAVPFIIGEQESPNFSE